MTWGTYKCNDCGWSGAQNRLACSDDDRLSDKEIDMIDFDLCPRCGSKNIEEVL
jgi:predicted RNA-binding Zn-ribbon protein involved in translation (DUF1610 family)